jgi:hypothetical protein
MFLTRFIQIFFHLHAVAEPCPVRGVAERGVPLVGTHPGLERLLDAGHARCLGVLVDLPLPDDVLTDRFGAGDRVELFRLLLDACAEVLNLLQRGARAELGLHDVLERPQDRVAEGRGEMVHAVAHAHVAVLRQELRVAGSPALHALQGLADVRELRGALRERGAFGDLVEGLLQRRERVSGEAGLRRVLRQTSRPRSLASERADRQRIQPEGHRLVVQLLHEL